MQASPWMRVPAGPFLQWRGARGAAVPLPACRPQVASACSWRLGVRPVAAPEWAAADVASEGLILGRPRQSRWGVGKPGPARPGPLRLPGRTDGACGFPEAAGPLLPPLRPVRAVG